MATVNVRYMVNDVDAAVAFYTTHVGFTLVSNMAPAFADVVRGDLRLENLVTEVERLRSAGVRFRNDIIAGPGWSQILLEDPSGNPIELFQPGRTPA
jgi:catechol 2,3-dioxygenase-like lactoylglutathione lyase family enzyme